MVGQRIYDEIMTDVFVIHDSMFPLYVIRDQKNVLVDCSILARAKSIYQVLTRLLGQQPVHTVLLTHSHYDHTGACSFLQDKYHFNIFCSQRTKEILENPKSLEFINKLNRNFSQLLGSENSDLIIRTPQNIHHVCEGDKITISEQHYLQVYETPGHTRCSISFLLQPEKIFFIGDAAGVIEKNKKIKPLFLSSYLQYEESLNKIKQVDAEILALPHNNLIKGRKNVADFLNCALEATRLAKFDILEALKKTDDINQIASDILAGEFPLPTIAGPREALLINLTAMVKAVKRECSQKS